MGIYPSHPGVPPAARSVVPPADCKIPVSISDIVFRIGHETERMEIDCFRDKARCGVPKCDPTVSTDRRQLIVPSIPEEENRMMGMPFRNPLVPGSLTDPGLVPPHVGEKGPRGVIPPHCGDPDAVPGPDCPGYHHRQNGTVNVTIAAGVDNNNRTTNSTFVMPALRVINDTNQDINNYQGEQLDYDPTSMGFAIGILILISAFFAWLIIADCSRKYRFKKLLFWRRWSAKTGGSSGDNNEKSKGTASSASSSPSVKPFDAAAQMESGAASGSEGETTLQADPSRENVGAGPASSSTPPPSCLLGRLLLLLPVAHPAT
ncbi:hypothetical protein PG996_006078 [Apiospora saccharicola]|uniref:Uncharacterized protein n=1 Tax=Apiospora saccharicola TaxID=335842 RepID=A0ABR1VN96_9PEZI